MCFVWNIALGIKLQSFANVDLRNLIFPEAKIVIFNFGLGGLHLVRRARKISFCFFSFFRWGEVWAHFKGERARSNLAFKLLVRDSEQTALTAQDSPNVDFRETPWGARFPPDFESRFDHVINANWLDRNESTWVNRTVHFGWNNVQEVTRNSNRQCIKRNKIKIGWKTSASYCLALQKLTRKYLSAVWKRN